MELYDHQSDPSATTNIAAAHAELVREFSKQLNAIIGKMGAGSGLQVT